MAANFMSAGRPHQSLGFRIQPTVEVSLSLGGEECLKPGSSPDALLRETIPPSRQFVGVECERTDKGKGCANSPAFEHSEYGRVGLRVRTIRQQLDEFRSEAIRHAELTLAVEGDQQRARAVTAPFHRSVSNASRP